MGLRPIPRHNIRILPPKTAILYCSYTGLLEHIHHQDNNNKCACESRSNTRANTSRRIGKSTPSRRRCSRRRRRRHSSRRQIERHVAGRARPGRRAPHALAGSAVERRRRVEAVRHVFRRALEADLIAAWHCGPITCHDKWTGELVLAVEGAVATVAIGLVFGPGGPEGPEGPFQPLGLDVSVLCQD